MLTGRSPRNLLWQGCPCGLSTVVTNYVRKLILGDVRLYLWHLGYLMPPGISFGIYLVAPLRQLSAAVSALFGQQHLNSVHLGRGNQPSMMSGVSWLSARLPLVLALVFSATAPLLTGQSVRRWRFGGVGGVLFPPRQLPLQIGYLLFGVGDLLFTFGYFTTKLVVLSQQSLIFPMQLFTAGLIGVPMAIPILYWLCCPTGRSRTHPPYNKRSVRICPEKSTRPPELLRFSILQQ